MLKEIIIFSVGAVVGSLVTMSVVKSKYERIAQDEINDVKSYYDRKRREEFRREVREEGYKGALEDFGYIQTEEEETPGLDAPYVIPPSEFDAYDDYTAITLTWYSDGVLADENNAPVDIELVGSKNLEYFGVYEEDAVYIRCDSRKCDYEVLRDNHKHEDILETMPPLPVTDARGNIVVYEDEEEMENEDQVFSMDE